MNVLRLLLFIMSITSAVSVRGSCPHYASPVNYDIVLAGNFGEPRPNHFHGGVDIKTGGVEGKPIFSVGDGYVSRISIGLYGFGNAVYVHHPDGYTSVYCHLKKFTPQITALLRRKQYACRRAEGEFEFRPAEMPVTQGQLIAVSGNTGASTAPHLHLEIHDNRTWNMLDPLDFIGDQMHDSVPPMAHAFMVYPVEGEGVFNGSTQKQSYGFSSHHLSQLFKAWGRVGFGLWANDYMQASYNHYGIRQTELFVDGRLVFSSDVSNIPLEHNMQVNAWGDYDHFLRAHVWYMKSFLEPGVTLPIISAGNERGIVNFNEERDYHFCYQLTDYKGNQSRYEFVVKGVKESIFLSGRNDGKMKSGKYFLRFDRFNDVQLPGAQLALRPYTLPNDLFLSPTVTSQPEAYSDAYQFMPQSFQLFRYVPIALRVHNNKVADTSKLYIVSHWGRDQYMGGEYREGYVYGKARELGATYELAYDDQPPVAQYLGLVRGSRGHVLRVSLDDGQSGISNYEAFLDGQFVLFEPVPKTSILECYLEDSPVRPKGKLRTLRFLATDNRQNQVEMSVQVLF
ncbi:MAG: M23 family metallopeptidase [Prevotella sp.]|nr:M23 family metallopeptidase [Prevotella sp.]